MNNLIILRVIFNLYDHSLKILVWREVQKKKSTVRIDKNHEWSFDHEVGNYF